MFGLMTVARHERELAKDAADYEATLRRSTENLMAIVAAADRDADGWRLLATKLAADLVELRKREAPPIPGPEESAVASVEDGDADWTPSAIDRRKKAAK